MTLAPVDHVKDILAYFKIYALNPFQGMKEAPNWTVPTLLIVQFVVNVALGVLAAWVSGNLVTLFVLPVVNILTCALGTLVFYLLFYFLYNREIVFNKTYTVVFLAFIPFYILRILSPLIAPIDLLGFAVTLVLMTVGFVENFQLPKKTMIKFFGGVFFLFFVAWSVQQFGSSSREMSFRKNVPDVEIKDDVGIDDVDKIEEEINKNF